ncbi:MAG: DNA recombination protein RmuC, partial [Alistipes sp.]|nr:DNA recombination protein RmuC [Alistipes sp.]
ATGGKLSSEADRLARALSSDVRMQGNLGEKLLEDLLAGSGLIEGKQYLLQRTIRQGAGVSSKNEDTGRVMKPDAMIFYPATKSVLYIDSKFQLPTDIDDNMDAARQEEVLKEFSLRLRTQVKSLAARGYQRYKHEEYVSLPYVIMFVPSDKALMAVTAYDKTLWLDAFNSKVFIASERHLLMLIEMISVVWVQQQHLDNQDKIVAQASVILDRVTDFVDSFDDIGQSLERAVAAFEKTKKKGIGGGQTISVAVRDMLKLGIKPQVGKQKKLDAQLADAGLEGSEG